MILPSSLDSTTYDNFSPSFYQNFSWMFLVSLQIII